MVNRSLGKLDAEIAYGLVTSSARGNIPGVSTEARPDGHPRIIKEDKA